MEGGHNFEGHAMEKERIQRMLDFFEKSLKELGSNPDYSYKNLARRAAAEISRINNGPGLIHLRDQVITKFVENLAQKVIDRDTNPGIDRVDVVEEVVRESGVCRENEVNEIMELVAIVMDKHSRNVVATHRSITHKPPNMLGPNELEALRIAKQRGDHLLNDNN